MSTDTSTEKTSIWQDLESVLKNRLSSLMTSRDFGSWSTRYGRNTNDDLFITPKLTPPEYRGPYTSGMQAETFSYRMYDPIALERIYLPNRGIVQWVKWQEALRQQEAIMLRAQKELVEKARYRWSGDTGWAGPYGQTKWELSRSSLRHEVRT